MMAQALLERLFETARRAGRLLILPHNDPDPDAIASAVALRHLLEERLGMVSPLVYHGIIGRAENKALVRYLGDPLSLLPGKALEPPVRLALVDTQPGAGNVALPPGATVTVVIDHHACREETETADYFDVRPDLGSTSAILTSYLRAAGVEPPAPLATALFYGIKTVTMGLSRDTSPADAAAYAYLQPRIDVEALAKIEHAQVPAGYFRCFDAALRAARFHDGLILAFVPSLSYPDLAAEMADVLLRLERAQWVVCMGEYLGVLVLSVRTRGRVPAAEELVRAIVAGEGSAGGHGTMAGGQIPLGLRRADELSRLFGRRALQHLGIEPEGAGELLV
jgi:nanoRNase/pAp phosphatase (c-di-AMP/oligoRNAs hydrolase)